MNNPNHINVFIAYARLDIEYLHKLRTYLRPLDRNRTIKIWYDGEIVPGTPWEQEIKKHLHGADIILLLVSAYSLASDYFYDQEVKDALERHRKNEAIVVPVILSDCAWEFSEFSELQALPQDGKPISNWLNESSAYTSVVRGLHQSVKEIQSRKNEKRKASQVVEKQPEKSEPKIVKNHFEIIDEKFARFTDPRDGERYKVVKLLDGNWWLAENLRFKIDGSFCYDNDEDNCKKYGRLYTWEAAQQACPKGWHLPSKDEIDSLIKIYDGKGRALIMNLIEGGRKTAFKHLIKGGESGFDALLGGNCYTHGTFLSLGARGYYWSATETDGGYAYYYYFDGGDQRLDRDYRDQGLGFSVRCLQN